MRMLTYILPLTLAAAVYAGDPTKVDAPPPPPIPANLPADKPAAEPAPADKVDGDKDKLEQDAQNIVVIKKADATITEYRAGGRVYMQKVQPKVGPPYYLVDDLGDGSMVRRDADPIQPPRWTIKTF